MKKILEKSYLLVNIATFSLLITVFFSFAWGMTKAFKSISVIIQSYGQERLITLYLIQVIDSFLISVIILIFTVSIHELFIGELKVPECMKADNLDELKRKLSNMVVLVVVIKFVEKLVSWEEPQATLLYACSTFIICIPLILLAFLTQKKEKRDEGKR